MFFVRSSGWDIINIANNKSLFTSTWSQYLPVLGVGIHHSHNTTMGHVSTWTLLGGSGKSLPMSVRPYLKLQRGLRCSTGASVSCVERCRCRPVKLDTEKLSSEGASWDWCKMQQRWTDDVSVPALMPPPLFLTVSVCTRYLACPLLLSCDSHPSVTALSRCCWLTHAGLCQARLWI